MRNLAENSSQCYALSAKAIEGGARHLKEMARSAEAPGPVGDGKTMAGFWVFYVKRYTRIASTCDWNQTCFLDTRKMVSFFPSGVPRWEKWMRKAEWQAPVSQNAARV